MTPTARSLAWARKQGYQAAVVEKWIPQTGRRLDVWGFGDLLLCDPRGPRSGACLVQVTSSSNVAARVTKIREECADAARGWLKAGNGIAVHGWSRKGAAGKRKLWEVRVVPVTLADLPEEQSDAA